MENRFLRSRRRAETIALLGQSAIKYGGFVGIAYFIYLSVKALAGHITDATIAFKFLGDMHVSIVISWGVTIGAIIYGRMERSLRKDVVERLAGRNASLEEGIDPRRSSSRLTSRGDTPES